MATYNTLYRRCQIYSLSARVANFGHINRF